MKFKRSRYLVLTINYLIPIFVILTVTAAYFVTFHTKVFRITQINCQLDYQPCNNPSIIAELDRYHGRNLTSFKESALHDRLMSGDFTIRSVEISKRFPHTLELALLSTYPVIAIQQIDHQQEWVTLDKRLRIIGVRPSFPNVPVLEVTSLPAFQLGKVLADSTLISAIESLLVIARELPSLESAKLSQEDSLELNLAGGKTAIIATNKDLDDQLRTLSYIMISSDTIAKYSIIDLRFAQPVLK